MNNKNVNKMRKLLSREKNIKLREIVERSFNRFKRRFNEVRWVPSYLLENLKAGKYLAFYEIYDAEYFPDTISNQIEKARGTFDFDFYFILRNELLLDVFEENCKSRGFGLILHCKDEPILVREALIPINNQVKPQTYIGHFPEWLINETVNINIGNAKFTTALKDFSKIYKQKLVHKKLNEINEQKIIRDTILSILNSDERFNLGIDSLELLNKYENIFSEMRDHYFHSFHIFLLGLVIINRYRDDFIAYYKNTFPKYSDFSIEFLWLMTSIFHDIGYTISKMNDYREEIYKISSLTEEKDIIDVWNDDTYKTNLEQVISLFKFSLEYKKRRINWIPDVLGAKDEKLERILRESFYDSHGVASCFKFLVDIFEDARNITDPEQKTFLVNHIYPAALSISLHDKKFRERLSKIGIKQIKLSRFPFAVLLAYLDGIQEDGREKYLCIETPELLQKFEFNGKVIAVVNREMAENYPRIGKIKLECRDFIKFFECDGIRFEYSEVLL